MQVEVIEKKENILLERTEVKFKLSYQGATPTRKDVRSKVIAVLNSDKELTVVDKIDGEYGAQTAMGYVKVYANKKAMKLEPEYLIKRNFPVAKEGEEPQEAPTVEAPKKEAPAKAEKPSDGKEAK